MCCKKLSFPIALRVDIEFITELMFAVLVSGVASDWFTLSMGLLQGDPLSLVYVMVRSSVEIN